MNAWLYLGPAATPPDPLPLPLPRPEAVLPQLRGTAFADSLIPIADAVLRREFSLLGYHLTTEREIRWRRDYVSGRETSLTYFRRIPYLDFSQCGDHKIIWELNRHQHLVALAEAYLIAGTDAYLADLWQQLDSWLDQNPFCQGINWTSALEVAFRALSWLWIEHLAGGLMPASLRRRWLVSFFQHGQHLFYNLSVYFSPNTHLQGEALALHALGVLFGVRRWRDSGAAVLREIIHTHVRADGGHFEQSSYYHVYSTDMFLFHALLEPVDDSYRGQLRKMAGYLWALCSSGEIPLFGDDDGGRLFHPYGARRQFGRATLATCAALLGDTPWHGVPGDLEPQALWWLGPQARPSSVETSPVRAVFPETGVAVLSSGGFFLHADTRAFGVKGAGHSHAHALHFTLKRGSQDVLIDPGTYTYVAEPALRDLFRGTAMHNTIRVDGLDQADPAGPFRWANPPQISFEHWSPDPWMLDASVAYRGIQHRRQMAWSGQVLFVLDFLTGPGQHRADQFWHPGGKIRPVSQTVVELPASVFLVLPEGSNFETGPLEYGWYSPAPGSKVARPVLRVSFQGNFPALFAAALVADQAAPLEIEQHNDGVILHCAGSTVRFPQI